MDALYKYFYFKTVSLASDLQIFYKELSDNEIEQMEQAYTQVFERKSSNI